MFTGARLKPGTGRAALKRIALLLPKIRIVVVPVALPEARLVVVEQLEPAKPLRALPEITARHDQAQRPAVLRFQRLAVGFIGDHRLLALEGVERHVGREALLRMGDHEACAWLWPDELGEIAPMNPAEPRVEAAPAGDAVDVDRDLGRRQLLQLLPRQRGRILDLAEDLEIP